MNTINTEQLIKYLLEQENKTLSLDQLIKLFYQKLKLNNRKGTINGYTSTLKPIMNYLKRRKIIYVHQITTEIINDYIDTRYGNVKNITINKEVKALKTMLNFAVENDYIDKIPFKFKKLKETKTIIESINSKDINKIINYFNNCLRDKKYILAFMLILTTGIRTTELINIKNHNIDLTNKTILLDFTKNGRNRYIYIVDEIYDLVKEIMDNDYYLFKDNHHEQMTANSLRCFFKHIKKELSIDVLSPHKLRHYYATSIYNNSLDIYLTSTLLGHSDIKMTQIYLDINDNNNREKNQIFNPLIELDPLTL
jgi:integrase/recombinase XerD